LLGSPVPVDFRRGIPVTVERAKHDVVRKLGFAKSAGTREMPESHQNPVLLENMIDELGQSFWIVQGHVEPAGIVAIHDPPQKVDRKDAMVPLSDSMSIRYAELITITGGLGEVAI
jgi:hypothetical protein